MREVVSVEDKTQGRNLLDVAMELTKFHIREYGISDEEDLKKTYTEYYSLAKVLGKQNSEDLKRFLPESITKEL